MTSGRGVHPHRMNCYNPEIGELCYLSRLRGRSTRSAAQLRARARRLGERTIHANSASCGGTPTPTLPRKRERERAAAGASPRFNFQRARKPIAVIPGWSAWPDPESRDSGFDASHRPGMTKSGSLPLRNDVKRKSTNNFALAAQRARAMHKILSPEEGAGNAGCPLHPQPPVQCRKHRGRSHRYPGTPGIPCAMVLTAYVVLSPVTGLFCHRHLAD